jgi:WD40 repeat protein
MIATKPLSPYKGLVPFGDSELDALLFFGREREGQIIGANVLAARLTVLYGPSGVGKTSVLRAGVAYRLRELARGNIEQRGHPEFAVVVFDAWSDEPVSGIREAVREELSALFGSALLDERDGESLADTLERWTDALACDVLLILDQAEEYFLYHAEASGFADELPELVTRPGLRVRALLALRDDALAKLDRFKGRIPSLFANYLRLDHLDRRSARDAIVKPVERYNDVAKGEPVEIEPALLEAVLSQTAAGKVDLSEGGRGLGPGETDESRIEAPYLQLVMERIWEEEGAQSSRVLRAETLERLGGAQAIARTHLRRAVEGLSTAERDVAADVFRYLVTPSGTKIAHGLADLAEYATVDANRLLPVLHTLGRERIIRPVTGGGAEEARYEIFHDVLAEAVLAWRTRHDADAALIRERAAARKRLRRLSWLAAAALIALAAMTALAVYAFTQRGEAREQAALASSQQQEAEEQAALAVANELEAEKAQAEAQESADTAQKEKARAERLQQVAEAARADAEAEKADAVAAEELATHETERAEEGETAAEDAAAEAVRQRQQARRAQQRAVLLAARARRQEDKARAAERAAEGRELVARSLAMLATDPEQSARLAVRASGYQRDQKTENALRAALVALRVEHILPGTGAGPEALARYSGDGSRIVVGGGPREVKVYRAADAQHLKTFRAAAVLVDAVLSPNGRLVAAGGVDGRIRVWEVDSGDLRATLSHGAPVRAVAWSPRGDVLASVGAGSAPSARLWSVGSWGLMHPLRHPRALHTVSFSNDGRRVVTAGEGRIARVWDVESGALLALPEHATGEITSAAFSPGGDLLVTGGRDRVARIWDVATGDSGHTLGEHQGQVLDVAFAPNGRSVATASGESVGRLFDVASGNLLTTLGGHAGPPLNDIAFSPNSTALVTAGADHSARHFGAGQLPVPLLGHQDEVTEASFGPRGRVLTASRDGQARIWDPNAEPRVGVRNRHSNTVTSVAVSPDGSQVASGSADGVVQVSSIGGRVTRTLPLGARVVRVAWGGRGLLLAATSNGIVRVWSDDGARLLVTIRHRATLRDAALSGNGRVVASAGQDGAVRLWRLPSGEEFRVIRQSAVTSVALDRTGGVVATATGQTASLWRSNTRRELRGHTNTITDVTFNSSGTLVATSSADRTAQVWAVKTGKKENRFVGHSSSVAGVAFSPDSRWLVTAGPIKAGVWQVGDSDLPRNFLFFLAGYDQPLTSIAFSKRDWTIVTGSSDGTVRSYECVYCGRLGNLVRFARARLTRLDAERRR